ncbi:hypothetical protein [Sorangium sp. So ce887]|uniref:hypothetical protein n=1 Tax=Sorangium sp. So ce887 TaxID=3133324 RepID=UPI003F60C384
MSFLSKMVLPLTLLGAAAVLGGCVGDASLEGDDGQETLPEAAEAADLESTDAIDPDAAEAVGTAQQALIYTWGCYKGWSCGGGWCVHNKVGQVDVGWGNGDYWDAQWACKQWVPACYDGGCGVELLRTR